MGQIFSSSLMLRSNDHLRKYIRNSRLFLFCLSKLRLIFQERSSNHNLINGPKVFRWRLRRQQILHILSMPLVVQLIKTQHKPCVRPTLFVARLPDKCSKESTTSNVNHDLDFEGLSPSYMYVFCS
ncbi:hypothetical protein Mapa_002448 [Marchantia paleacea]|nr:hypothetical protein Mapa_002448 [Marchantia paleacea]